MRITSTTTSKIFLRALIETPSFMATLLSRFQRSASQRQSSVEEGKSFVHLIEQMIFHSIDQRGN